jgi:hypothetical protein
MQDKIEKYKAAARRAAEWTLSFMNEDGSYKETEHIVMGMFKAPLAMKTAGYVKEAETTLNYIEKHFFEDGNFNEGHCDPSMSMFNNYRNAWMCWGAHELGRDDLANAGADYLESMVHPEIGGIPCRKEYHDMFQILDWGSTALGLVALSVIGRKEAAIKCGEFLEKMLDDQPEPDERLYLRKLWLNKHLITVCQPHEIPEYVLDFQLPGMAYWYFGAAMAGLTKLYELTQDSRWLKTADRIFGLTQKCRKEVYEDLTSGKIGWGCSWLYQATGDQKYADAVIKVADHQLKIQEQEGGWVRRPIFQSLEEQPNIFGIEVTQERVVWFNYYAQALSSKK